MSAETVAPPSAPDSPDIAADEQPTQVMDPVGAPGIPEDEQPTQVMDPVAAPEDGILEDERPTQVMDPVVPAGGGTPPPAGAHEGSGGPGDGGPDGGGGGGDGMTGGEAPFDEQPTEIMPGPGDPAPESLPPSDDDELARSLQIKVVDASEGVVAKATDAAEAHLAEQTTQKGFRGFLKRIWHGNIARDYIRLRRSQQAREEIVESGNLYAMEEGSQAEHDQEMAAVVTRFTEGYLHDGEREDQLADKEGGTSLEAELRTLVNFYAQGAIDADVLTEQKNRVLDRYKEELHGEDRNKGLLLADNVVEVARNARAALAHGIGMERIQAALSASAGEARMGQRTEAGRELTDKIVDKLYSHKVGSLVNETTLAVAAGIGITAAKLTTRKAATAAAATVSMGVGAGVIAGIREHARVGHERQQHLRERAAGHEAPGAGDRRREQMEDTRYDTVSASELTDSLAAAREAVAAAEPAGIQDALQVISEAEARIRLSDEKSVDLIDFSRTTSLEQERLKLDIALAEAKVAAGRALQGADEAALRSQGLDRDLDTVLATRLEGVHDVLREDMSAKDAAFTKLRRNRTVKMAAAGLVTGLAIGEAVQEAHALLDENLKGIFEPGNHHTDNRTLLAGMLATHGSDGSYHAGVHEAVLGKHAALELPKNFHIEKAGAGHWNLIDPQGKAAAEGITLDGHGHLTPESIEALQHSGLHMGQQLTQNYETRSIVQHTVHRSAQEFLNRHPSDFTHVDRQFWYDNDTPGVFDQNELKLDWGANGTGMDGQGNYVFNVSEMLPDGSYHDGFSANAQNLFHEGKMAIALSMTQDTQDHVVMIPIDSHGNAVIHADSWMAKSMFENSGGQAHFTGAYAEAVQLMGKHDGSEAMRPLATVVGSGQMHEVTDTVSKVVTHHHERVVTHLIHGHHRVEIPPPLPIYGRRGLEKLERAQTPAGPAGGEGSYYGYESLDDERRRAAERSPRLEADPEARLNPGEELEWYREQLKNDDEEYLKEIDEAISTTPELREIGAETRALVAIPVGATSEADNIYRTLSLYAQQDPDVLRQTTVVLNVNWVDRARENPDQSAAIDKTLAEIERAKEDFPELKVAAFQTVMPRELVQQKDGAVIGLVAKRLLDTALMSVEQAKQDGRQQRDQEVLVIRNDADAQGMSKNYLRNMIRAIGNNPDTDVFTGSVRWDISRFKDYPGFAAVSTFREVMHAIAGRANTRIPTIGINHAIKMSTLAAVGCLGNGSYTGPGSDDLEVGYRVYSARLRTPSGETSGMTAGYYSSAASDITQPSDNASYGPLSRLASAAGRHYGSSGRDGTSPVPIKAIGGALIDSAADRILDTYRSGRSITDAWRNFNGNSRSEANSSESLKGPEDLATSFDSVAGQIQQNMEDMARIWFRDPAYFRLGLRYTCPEFAQNGDRIYEFSTGNGAPTFKFTDAGRTWLRGFLEKNYENGRVRNLNYEGFTGGRPGLLAPA